MLLSEKSSIFDSVIGDNLSRSSCVGSPSLFFLAAGMRPIFGKITWSKQSPQITAKPIETGEKSASARLSESPRMIRKSGSINHIVTNVGAVRIPYRGPNETCKIKTKIKISRALFHELYHVRSSVNDRLCD